jgi:hypothetical protein
MELISADVRQGSSAERARLVGRVRYDAPEAREEELWFEVPHQLAGDLATSGTPWLAALLPLAVTLNEPLRIALPVDARVRAGAHELMDLWCCWYPQLRAISITAPASAGAAGSGPRTAAFFSGGLDSLFTLLRTRDDVGPARVDDLLTVVGFDVALDRAEAGRRMHARSGEVAAALHRTSVPVTTNLRQTRWRVVDWEYLGCGAALAAVALALEPRYGAVLVGSSGGYRDLHVYGSHPLVEPLFSSTTLQLLHDGAAFTRVEKMRFITQHDIALRSLHVCWRSGTDENCGACKKCYRAMLMLELLGVRERCTTFHSAALDVSRVGRMYCSLPWDYRELCDIEALAREHGRPDIARGAAQAMRASRRLARRLERVRALPRLRSLQRSPHAWKFAATMEARLLRGWIQ